MSAFLVTHKHINTIISYGNGHPWAEKVRLNDGTTLSLDQTGDLQRAAEILLAENVRSLNSRYPDTLGKPERMPGYVPELGRPITHRFENGREPVQIIKACDCYDYQACETDDYKESDAHRIVEAIRGRAIGNLPGYEEADWAID